MHAHAHLARPGLGLGQIDELQNLGAPKFKKTDCAHGVFLVYLKKGALG
jgi:hypothetical protein